MTSEWRHVPPIWTNNKGLQETPPRAHFLSLDQLSYDTFLGIKISKPSNIYWVKIRHSPSPDNILTINYNWLASVSALAVLSWPVSGVVLTCQRCVPSLPQTVAILVKRRSVEDEGAQRSELLANLQQLIHSSDINMVSDGARPNRRVAPPTVNIIIVHLRIHGNEDRRVVRRVSVSDSLEPAGLDIDQIWFPPDRRGSRGRQPRSLLVHTVLAARRSDFCLLSTPAST